MSQTRKTLIYGNCQVFSPDGVLMFRCLEKRVKWYLNRNLAEIIGDNPLSIKLNFTPKGNGESIDVLKMERYNKCVICGKEDLNILTKHHLVPFVYRQHFPEDRKQHSSLFVVPICRECHFKYENEHACKLKDILAETYSAPLNVTTDNPNDKILGIIRCLIQFNDRIPEDRKEKLRKSLLERTKDIKFERILDFKENSHLEYIQKVVEAQSKEKPISTHGKIVVDNIKNLDEFEKMWAKHFVDNMNPQYMPEYLIKTLCSLSV